MMLLVILMYDAVIGRYYTFAIGHCSRKLFSRYIFVFDVLEFDCLVDVTYLK